MQKKSKFLIANFLLYLCIFMFSVNVYLPLFIKFIFQIYCITYWCNTMPITLNQLFKSFIWNNSYLSISATYYLGLRRFHVQLRQSPTEEEMTCFLKLGNEDANTQLHKIVHNLKL